MALTNASRLADFGTGIGTQGAILQVDNADQMVGIGTTDPTSKLEVKGDFKVSAASTLSGAVKISDSTNSTSTTTGALIVTGGVGIGASLHVDGDVSIGGTLTYEDVTNIDSVGLITARSGINVSGGEFKVGTALTVGSAGVTTISARVYIRSSFPRLDLEDTDSDSDFAIINSNGDFMVWDQTNSANRFSINSSGVVAANSDLEVAGSQYITDSIIHTGDTNTKIRFPAADQVKIETAGSNRLHITENGKIGVGGDPTAYPGKFVVIGAAGGASGILCDREIISRVSSGIANTERGFQQIIDGVEKLACFADNSGNFNLNNNNGKNRITVTEAGKVGLGTVNPQLNLHIHAESSNASFAHFTNTTTGVSGSDGVSIGIDSDENVAIYNYESSAIRLVTGGTERARIDSSGRLLVGHTATDDRDGYNSSLQVSGTTGDDASACIGRWSGNGSAPALAFSKSRNGTIGSHTVVQAEDTLGLIQFQGDDGTNYHVGAQIKAIVESGVGNDDMPARISFETNSGSTSTSERMRLTPEGRLVIGSTQAHGTLVSRSADDTKQLILQNSTSESGSFDNETGMWFKGHQSQDDERAKAAIIHQCTADYGVGDLVICVDGAADNGDATIANDEVMRISADLRGRFGANDFTGGSSDTARFKIASTTNEVYTLALTERGGQCLALATRLDGNGSSTNAVRFFDGPGIASVATINVSASTVTYGTGSDYRMKENQVDISDGITRVKQLKPYRFNWKSEYGGGDKVDGFFAHEVSPVVPNAVKGDKDAVDSDGNIIRQQIDQAKLVPVLTAALQEAIAKIETLEARLDAAGL